MSVTNNKKVIEMLAALSKQAMEVQDDTTPVVTGEHAAEKAKDIQDNVQGKNVDGLDTNPNASDSVQGGSKDAPNTTENLEADDKPVQPVETKERGDDPNSDHGQYSKMSSEQLIESSADFLAELAASIKAASQTKKAESDGGEAKTETETKSEDSSSEGGDGGAKPEEAKKVEAPKSEAKEPETPDYGKMAFDTALTAASQARDLAEKIASFIDGANEELQEAGAEGPLSPADLAMLAELAAAEGGEGGEVPEMTEDPSAGGGEEPAINSDEDDTEVAEEGDPSEDAALDELAAAMAASGIEEGKVAAVLKNLKSKNSA